jgi:hypothetical protein
MCCARFFFVARFPCDQDFFFDPYANRDYVFDVESVGVFPANERVQGRWNGDPYV